MVDVRLDLIAAKAKQLAEDYRKNRLWPGDLTKGLNEIREQLDRVEGEKRDNDWGDR